MRHDDDSSTAQRVSRLLDQARRSQPPDQDDVWPQEWPPGTAGGPEDGRTRLDPGPRWQIPVPAAVAAAVLALVVVGLAAVLLLRGPSPGTVVPARDPAPLGGVPTGSPAPSGLTAAAEPTASQPVAPGTPGMAPAGGGSPVDAPGAEAGATGQFRVYVVGQVRRPGVVTLPAGARVEDAVQAVGGATVKADLAVMNLARRVVDGERIVVPRPGEKVPTADPVPDPAAGAGAGATAGAAGSMGAVPGAPVDLNTATVAQLDALPGVGPVIAARIVTWRQENGRFTTVDDLAEVQGIGDATMANLRPLVRV